MSTRQIKFIGIDLGTYNSVACALVDETPVLLRPAEAIAGRDICIPSVVEFDNAGNFVQAGELARRSMAVYPDTVVWGVKRLTGRSYKAAKATND